MHSDMIGKIEKARHYTREPERVQIFELKALFRGSNSTHQVSFKDGNWHCDSPSFANWGISAHIMAAQKLLDAMLIEEARQRDMATGIHMHSEMIGKIEKARRYAEEPERLQILELKARFRGDNSIHMVSLDNSQWHCDSEFFRNWGTSAQVMAMQKILEPMLSSEARQPTMTTGVHTEMISL